MKVDGQKAVIDVKDEVELPSLQEFRNAGLPGEELKLHLVASRAILPTQTRKYRGANIVRACDPEVALLADWIEGIWRDQLIHFGQQNLKFLQDLATSQGELETVGRADQEGILKHCACSLQCAAYGRLAEQEAGCCGRNAFFLCNRGESDEEI